MGREGFNTRSRVPQSPLRNVSTFVLLRDAMNQLLQDSFIR